MMLRRLLPGIWRRRRVDDQDDVATAAEETHGTGHGHRRYSPPNEPDPRDLANARWLAARRREEEEIALLLTMLVAADE